MRLSLKRYDDLKTIEIQPRVTQKFIISPVAFPCAMAILAILAATPGRYYLDYHTTCSVADPQTKLSGRIPQRFVITDKSKKYSCVHCVIYSYRRNIFGSESLIIRNLNELQMYKCHGRKPISSKMITNIECLRSARGVRFAYTVCNVLFRMVIRA